MSNATKAKPGIEIVLDGKTLTLVFDLLALVQVERTIGKTVPELLTSGSMEGILVMLWAAAQRHHPGMTEDEIGQLIDMNNINQVSEVLGAALSQASPEEEPESGGSKNEESLDGTGSTSGQ